ncbi:helix-turn-helix transcriptional regulator [Cohnella soli]|uniref:Helix-turn-helix transcriptional regulator n=1 Tax=Cohnella soli TaxID=425005 RepID=A0ABW0HSQ8_9BACL
MKYMQIVSLFSLTVLPQCQVTLRNELKQLYLFEGSAAVEVTWKGKSTVANQEDIVVGETFQIKNTSAIAVKLKGIALRTTHFKLPSKTIVLDRESAPHIACLIHSNEETVERLLTEAENQIAQLCEASVEQVNGRPGSREATDSLRKQTGRIDNRLIVANRHIRRHYDQPLTLQVLADLICCNPVYFCNTYSKVFKISPMKELQTIRMNKAAELLRSTHKSIKEIAANLCYVSSSQFSMKFKEYYNCTPNEYRRATSLQRSNEDARDTVSL